MKSLGEIDLLLARCYECVWNELLKWINWCVDLPVSNIGVINYKCMI
jgi:hypothetical protein